MIDIYIKERKESPSIFNLEDTRCNPFSKQIQDIVLRNKFKRVWDELTEEGNPKDVLEYLGKNSQWREKDIMILRNTTAEDFYHMFKDIRDKNLSLIITSVQEIGQYDFQNSDNKNIQENVKNALIKIGNESKINQQRVKRYGIELNSI